VTRECTSKNIDEMREGNDVSNLSGGTSLLSQGRDNRAVQASPPGGGTIEWARGSKPSYMAFSMGGWATSPSSLTKEGSSVFSTKESPSVQAYLSKNGNLRGE